MKPIILIVIDSLAWKPLNAHIDNLPTFKWLLENAKHGSMINDLKPPKDKPENLCHDDPIVLTSFCSATSLWTGKTPEEHRMLTSAWYKCVCHDQNPKHERPDFSRDDIKAKFIWEEIPNAVALHTLLFPMINYNCTLDEYIFAIENRIRFPFDEKQRFSFPIRITKILADKSVEILRDRKPPFFTCGLYGLDTPSHYNWNALDGFKELYPIYKSIDDYLAEILPFLKDSWFIVTTQHGMDDWFIVTKRRYGRPQGHKGIHGDHDEACPFFTNMDEPKTILDVHPIILKYAKREGMLQ